MDKWDSMLLEVMKDPIFANIKPVQPRPTSNDRLIKSFNEITDFVEQNGRLPDKDGIFVEKSLLKRLEGIIADEANVNKIIDCVIDSARPRPLETVSYTFRINGVSLSTITHLRVTECTLLWFLLLHLQTEKNI